MPKVSVIIPCYNVEKYIARCLDSVCNQTLKDIEIICVEDCSTDKTKEIIKKYSKKDKRVHLIELKKNSGAAAARNKGLEIATGEYIGFVDADDFIDTDFYEKLYIHIKNFNFDVVKGRARIISDNKKQITSGNQDILKNPLYFCSEHWSALYRKKFLCDNNIFYPKDVSTGQDVVFLSKVVLHTKNIGVVDDVFYNYVRRNNSLDSVKISHNKVLSRIKMLNYKIDMLKKHTFESINDRNIFIQQHIFLHFLYVFNALLSNKNDYKLLFSWLTENKDLFGKNILKNFFHNYQIKALYTNNFNTFIEPGYKHKFLYKERFEDGKRKIYVFGKNIFNYTKKEKVKNSVILSKFKKTKYIHLLVNDKFAKPFVDFINNNFNSKEHLFLCKQWYNTVATPFPRAKNVVKIYNYKDINFCNENIKKIICHSLFDQEIIDLLYKNKNILSKSYWMIWGGDLYNARRDKENDYVRKHIKAYISDTDGDNMVAMQKYKSKPITYNAGYCFPITLKMIQKTKRVPHKFIRIQINNSCDETTIDMLKTLSKYSKEDIRITTVLSYGQLEFKDEIIKTGKDLFGDKFEFIDKMMSPQQYTKHIAQNDILILNQNRQQGLGNCFVNLALGNKVFIKSDVTTYNHFNSRNIKIFDTYKIKNMDFKTFTNYNGKIRLKNKNKSLIFFSDEYLKSLWKGVFNDKI